MPAWLKDLVIREVSGVDKGAGEGVKIMLMKREFSDDKRKELASSGKALPDGSFPIENVGDLENAIRAIGRAKDPAKAKAHIISRARSLGASDKIPDDWKVGKGAFIRDLAKAAGALLQSVFSIVDDAAVADKRAPIEQSIDEFHEHLVEKALAAGIAAGGAGSAGATVEDDVSDAIKKALGLDAGATEEQVIAAIAKQKADMAKKDREAAILKLSQKHKDYMDDAEMDDGEKEKFLAKSPDERDQHMKDNPIEKRLPESIKKALDAAAEDRKILKVLKEKDEAATFAKRAKDIGLPENFGETLRKAYAGDPEAVKKLEEKIKSMVAIADMSKVFEEFGSRSSNGGAGASAEAQIVAKAEEYRLSQEKAGKSLTKEQAYTKVFSDPANAELRKQVKQEEAAKRRTAA